MTLTDVWDLSDIALSEMETLRIIKEKEEKEDEKGSV